MNEVTIDSILQIWKSRITATRMIGVVIRSLRVSSREHANVDAIDYATRGSLARYHLFQSRQWTSALRERFVGQYRIFVRRSCVIQQVDVCIELETVPGTLRLN